MEAIEGNADKKNNPARTKRIRRQQCMRDANIFLENEKQMESTQISREK